nr:hypothetical protein CFP56_41469 [Quercus suber]
MAVMTKGYGSFDDGRKGREKRFTDATYAALCMKAELGSRERFHCVQCHALKSHETDSRSVIRKFSSSDFAPDVRAPASPESSFKLPTTHAAIRSTILETCWALGLSSTKYDGGRNAEYYQSQWTLEGVYAQIANSQSRTY